MAIEHIKLSQQAKEQLITLKRYTKIEHWNILCRWAFCLSMADPTPPSPVKILADSNVEMSWKVFAGDHQEVYLALLKHRCKTDGHQLNDETLSAQFRLHLHRGIGYLAAGKKIRSIADLVGVGGKYKNID